ncbi:MAG: cytochrome c oxidase assembly protein [Gammaproteobacteria bacterium]|nr:cytochrome c oxidase assembly protein [Gammaproteobacteria bacterium]
MTDSVKPSHGKVAARMLLLAVGMFGFGYLMVPMYDIICEVTGLNGKTGRVTISEAADRNAKLQSEDRLITVEFTSSINAGGSWVFKPTVLTMQVKPGELYQTSYFAENLSNQTVVAQATPSVTPSTAAKYFNKTECFCFTRQEFEPKGSKDMPLTFVIDKDIPRNVDRVTLSYTFFNAPEQPS